MRPHSPSVVPQTAAGTGRWTPWRHLWCWSSVFQFSYHFHRLMVPSAPCFDGHRKEHAGVIIIIILCMFRLKGALTIADLGFLSLWQSTSIVVAGVLLWFTVCVYYILAMDRSRHRLPTSEHPLDWSVALQWCAEYRCQTIPRYCQCDTAVPFDTGIASAQPSSDT